MMKDADRIAASIEARVRQLERQGIGDRRMTDSMVGYMADLQWLWDNTSDDGLAALVRRYPGFYRYARMMEDMSAKEQAMHEAGTHPHMDMPVLPGPLRDSLMDLMRRAAYLEQAMQTTIDTDCFGTGAACFNAEWAEWLKTRNTLAHVIEATGISSQATALLANVLNAMAQRINCLYRKGMANAPDSATPPPMKRPWSKEQKREM